MKNAIAEENYNSRRAFRDINGGAGSALTAYKAEKAIGKKTKKSAKLSGTIWEEHGLPRF